MIVVLEFVKCFHSEQFTSVFIYKHNKIEYITLLLLDSKCLSIVNMPLSLRVLIFNGEVLCFDTVFNSHSIMLKWKESQWSSTIKKYFSTKMTSSSDFSILKCFMLKKHTFIHWWSKFILNLTFIETHS